ncbi:MAG: DUF3788 domain-containing protein, partial [Methanothrix sp.]|nr:DUF3788 domain-containing protein [Methanothrix sp.]
MKPLVLTNKNQFPTEEVVFSHIGKSSVIWKQLFQHIRKQHPDIAEEWRYYNDGKSWLMKAVRKSKTVFWLSVFEGGFRVTFYFTDKAEKLIDESPISASLKKSFSAGKHYGKIRGLTV